MLPSRDTFEVSRRPPSPLTSTSRSHEVPVLCRVISLWSQLVLCCPYEPFLGARSVLFAITSHSHDNLSLSRASTRSELECYVLYALLTSLDSSWSLVALTRHFRDSYRVISAVMSTSLSRGCFLLARHPHRLEVCVYMF